MITKINDFKKKINESNGNLPTVAELKITFDKINKDTEGTNQYKAYNETDSVEYYAEQIFNLYEDDDLTEVEAMDLATKLCNLANTGDENDSNYDKVEPKEHAPSAFESELEAFVKHLDDNIDAFQTDAKTNSLTITVQGKSINIPMSADTFELVRKILIGEINELQS